MLKSMPLLEQLTVLLRDARMLSFSDVISILAEHVDPHVAADKVLALLPQVGILLHGNWVPKSEVVFPEKVLSHANGVSAEQMIRARDYIVSYSMGVAMTYLVLISSNPSAALSFLPHALPVPSSGNGRHPVTSCGNT